MTDDGDDLRSHGRAFLADLCERQQRKLRELELERDGERARLRAWLAFISYRTSGMGADLARQALYGTTEPPTKKGPTHAKRRQARPARR